MQPDLYSLTRKVAVVTGGGKGLGKTLTRYLLENDMKVAICSRNQDTIANTVAELSNEFPGKIIGQGCDVSNAEQVKQFIEFVQSTFGDIHVLINNEAQASISQDVYLEPSVALVNPTA